MDIKINLNVNEANISSGQGKVASGWVELEECIKFPVAVRSYTDHQDGKRKMFVSYPQKKSGDGYKYTVYPHDREIKRQIDEAVLQEVKRSITKPLRYLEIDDVRVSLLSPRESSGPIKNLGIASIKIYGITVNGIMIKEGKNGLFVQMPQHNSESGYKDTFYGSTNSAQREIRDAVLNAYSKKVNMEKNVPEEKPGEKPGEKVKEGKEPESLPAADGILSLLRESDLTVTETGFTDDGAYIAFQEAVCQSGGSQITVVFSNHFDPSKEKPRIPIRQEILAFVPKKNGDTQMYTLLERSNGNVKDAEQGYHELLTYWMGLTGQESPQKVIRGKNMENEKHIRTNAVMPQPRL